MAQLTANRPFPNTLQQRLDLAGGVVVNMVMGTSITIYEGAFVGYVPATGTVLSLVANTNAFAGIALEKKTSDGTAGSTKIAVFIGGFFTHAITSLVVADVGKVVFAANGSVDNTLDLSSTTFPAVGRVVNFVSAGIGVIRMKECGARAGSSNSTVVYDAIPL